MNDDPFSDAAVARFRALPRFREAVEASARSTLVLHDEVEGALAWMWTDRGRYMTGMASVALLGMDALTAATLKAMVGAAGFSSPGRVAAFLTRMRDEGHLTMRRDASGALERHLQASPAYLDAFRRSRLSMVNALALMRPEAAQAAAAIAGDGFLSIETQVLRHHAAHRARFQTRPGDPLYNLIERDAALNIAFAWLGEQPVEREHMYEIVTLNTAALARRFGVSRIHVERLVADLQTRGLATLDRRTRLLTFEPAFSEAYETVSARFIIATEQGLVAAGLLDPAQF